MSMTSDFFVFLRKSAIFTY